MTKPPPVKREPRADTRRTILEAGIRSLLRKGYDQSGLAEILQEAKVPKGSFYYYFASKEDFGLQLIEHWLENYNEAESSLRDETLSPMTRVRRFFEARCRLFKRLKREYGSVCGMLLLEMATHNETFRRRVEQVLAGWQEELTACLVEAQAAGELGTGHDARTLAEFCLLSWEGAAQRARTVQSTAPLDLFFRVIFETFLVP
jgi:TetR/AcrR family transcriptional regulator, transcriptional repressor for nem operon